MSTEPSNQPLSPSAQALQQAASDATDRLNLWETILRGTSLKVMAEVGVQKGLFAAALLAKCSSLERYYMVDPWRQLENWKAGRFRTAAKLFAELLRVPGDRLSAFQGLCEVFLLRISGVIFNRIRRLQAAVRSREKTN
jgi:hypothetical protein